jgi:hypothetical protein
MHKRLQSPAKTGSALMRWHRRIGVMVSLLVMWLAGTGVVLNHSEQLQLDEQPVNQPLLLAIYGVVRPTPSSYFSADHWFSHMGGNQLYLDGVEVAYCSGALTGVVWYQQQFVISCNDGLLLMTADGEVIEQIGAAHGLPDAITGLALVDGQLVLNTKPGVWLADLEQLQWLPFSSAAKISWVVPGQPPQALAAQLQAHSGSELHWERVLLDLHSGRLGGQWGRGLMDLTALLLVVLACTGVWAWVKRPSS